MLRLEAEKGKGRGVSEALKNGVEITGIAEVFEP